nr:MAG TPA: protein of unknown function (DUF5047) [Caudoviricetes sp.]
MQAVSAAWKQNQENLLVSESFVEVKLIVSDPDAQAAASAVDNGSVWFSDTAEIVNGSSTVPPRYASLEQNLWALDGLSTILPDKEPAGNNGYIGNLLSNVDSNFSTNPLLTVSFSQVFTSLLQGITITWGNAYDSEYAVDFTVTVWNGSTTVATQAVTGNTQVISVVLFDIQNYNKITISVNKWSHPYHRARVQSILMGIIHTFDKDDLIKYQHNIEADMLSSQIPVNSISFEIQNLDEIYNPANPSGLGRYLMERQMVQVRYGYDLDGSREWIPGGIFFLSEWQTPVNGITATFTARDYFELMGEHYSGVTSGSLFDIATAALTQVGYPLSSPAGNQWVIDNTLKNIAAPTDINLSDNTIAEVLQLVANAATCVLFQDRQGIIHIGPIEPVANDYSITQDNGYGFPETTLLKQLKAVDINNSAYVLDVAEVGEVQQVNNPLISNTQAPAVAQWIRNTLLNRQNLSGEWRIDPRLDCLDKISIETPFETSNVIVTEIKMEYNGAFKGEYQGTVIS